LGTAEALYYTRPSRAVKQQFDKYFMGGMNVLEATVCIRIIRSHLKEFQKRPLLALLSTPNQELLASGMISGAKTI